MSVDKKTLKAAALEAWGAAGLKAAPHVLSSEEIVDIVLDKFIELSNEPVPSIPLASYRQGNKVEYLSDDGWVSGFVTEEATGGTNVHIHTNKGPVTVGNMNRLRPVKD